MSIDIGQFVRIFLEEANEHLATMESGLLGLDLVEPEAESLNAIFRAAHSIKGGAGTFGFADIADFTHSLETLLDRVRRGELAFDDERLDACLRAVDLLRAMLAGPQGADTGLTGDAAALAGELTALAGRPDQRRPDAAQVRASESSPSPRRRWRITLELPPHAHLGDDVVPGLLRTLEQFGSLMLEEHPGAGAAHGRWEMVIDTELEREGLYDFIAYGLAPEWVHLEPADQSPVAADDAAYGFFEPILEDEAVPTGEAYGLFHAPEASGPEELGFGFFEPLDPPACAPGAPRSDAPASCVVASAHPTHCEPGRGVFETALPPASPPAHASGADEAYGFFEPLPQAIAPAPAAPIAAGSAPSSRTAPASASAERTGGSEKPAARGGDATSIRVGINKVDQLINLVGELVITQSMLLQEASALDPVRHERMLSGLAQLERNSRDLQEAVMSIRMVPMSFVFSRYPRMVRDLARKLGKDVELQLLGESTELDKGLVEKIIDPLTHLVRNAIDHGLETPEDRRTAGKPTIGRITLTAAHHSGHILIEIHDDGAGLDRERILAKAARQGLSIHPDAPAAEVWDLIFAPGFSTAETVTDVSGRGVGMDVVRRNIQALGGSVHLSSVTGQGTRVSIRLPLTLAILDGMSVRSGEETFIVPLGFVVESLHGATLEFRSIGRDGKVVRLRDDYLPVVSLAELLQIPGASRVVEQAVLVVLEAEGRRLALAVDALLGQHQVVVKNLETNFRRVSGISGATILGDGRVSLILDATGLIRMSNPDSMSTAA